MRGQPRPRFRNLTSKANPGTAANEIARLLQPADTGGTKLAARYDEYKKKSDWLIKKLKTERPQLAIKGFHDSVHVEITRPLNSI
jgi:hypothetical protein